MAIQIPNPGTGNGATGDNEFVLWSKVKDNFSDQTNAASRLVGVNTNNVMQVGAFGVGAKVIPSINDAQINSIAGALGGGFYSTSGSSTSDTRLNYGALLQMPIDSANYPYQMVITRAVGSGTTSSMYFRVVVAGDYVTHEVYSTSNTTLDGNEALKPSSPVLRVFNDHIEGNHDGEAMAATYTKNGVGDYTITGTTGIRTDGWYVVIPNDMNGNPKVAIGTLDDKDGVITLKTYVRIFDMSTFKFVPDLEQPLDIPDGRWIDLRFNDLTDEPMPQEV